VLSGANRRRRRRFARERQPTATMPVLTDWRWVPAAERTEPGLKRFNGTQTVGPGNPDGPFYVMR